MMWQVRQAAMAAGALAALVGVSGCSASDEAAASASASVTTSSPSASSASEAQATASSTGDDDADESAAPEETSTAEAIGEFSDVNGTWCPTSSDDSGEATGEECVIVDLPAVSAISDDIGDILGTGYVYPAGYEDDGTSASDPTTWTLDDYDVPPDSGSCWLASEDAYPPVSGGAFWFCPAGAVSGIDYIDDVFVFEGDEGFDGVTLVDRTDQDRLYLGQDVRTPSPYVRAER